MSNAVSIARQRGSLSRSSLKTKSKTKHAGKADAPKLAIDPASLPEEYALRVTGDCMEPAIRDGAVANFSTTAPYAAGDVVCIWFQPAAATEYGAPCALKRLSMALPPWVKSFPYKDNPKSDVAALVFFESDNPRRVYRIKCSDVAAIHKFAGCE